jgi:hypothetical protein
VVYKKPEPVPVARPRLSLASRLLGGAVRATLHVPRPEEPGRNGTPQGRSRGKRRP